MERTNVSDKSDLLSRSIASDYFTSVSSDQPPESQSTWLYRVTPVKAGEDTFASSSLEVEGLLTPTGDELQESTRKAIRYAAAVNPNQINRFGSVPDEHERARDDRLVLLARKYTRRTVPIEEEARILLLTEKLRRIVPRVTNDDLDVLSGIASFLEGLD